VKNKNEIICINHVPGYMMIDISNALAEEYKTVYLLAGEIRKRSKDLAKNVRWIKIPKYNPKNTLSRLFTWVIATIRIFFFVLFKSRKVHLFITTNPPFGVFLPLLLKNRYTILVYDIYPDVLYEYKMLNKNHFIVKWWEKVNVKVLDNAYRLITIGEGMKSKISSYVSPDKIEIISCWTDSEFLKPVPKSKNKFIVDNKFEGKFLVLYSGNLGVTHDVEILVYLAELSKRNNLHFIIIGEGDKKRFIADLIQERKLSNIDLLSWQPVEMLPFSLSAADIAVVTLGTGASLMSVPSKLYDTMAVGSPLLIISEPEAEMARIVEDHNIGRSFQNGQLEEMLDFIYELMDNSEAYLNFRENALAASKHFTPYNAKSFKAINKNM